MMSDVASDILTLELHASTKLVNLLLIRALRPAYPLGKPGRMELWPKISLIDWSHRLVPDHVLKTRMSNAGVKAQSTALQLLICHCLSAPLPQDQNICLVLAGPCMSPIALQLQVLLQRCIS